MNSSRHTEVNNIDDLPKTDDSVSDDEERKSLWLRLVNMFLIILIYSATRVVVASVMLVQFITMLLTGRTNTSLHNFSESLSTYTFEIIRYLTFVTDRRPYPFDSEWPQHESSSP